MISKLAVLQGRSQKKNCRANPLNSDLNRTLDKVKKMFKPKKSNPKPVYESLPDRPQRMDSDPSHGLDLAKVESHLIKTAGILWGIRRRDFDEGNMDFLVERAMTDAVDDLD